MTDAEESEQEIHEEFSICKTFSDYCDLVNRYDTRTGYNEAFERIESAQDAYDLAWAAQSIDEESFLTKALSKCLDLATIYDEEDTRNSLRHVVDHHDWQFFYESIFQDTGLVRKMAELHGLDMTSN